MSDFPSSERIHKLIEMLRRSADDLSQEAADVMEKLHHRVGAEAPRHELFSAERG
jgi:hypothetical protein